MKLSMWMIANRLNQMDLELNIKKDAPIILKSARRAYATNCVHIFQSGNDVICNGEGDYIRIKDINISQGFEIVQSIFDFYNDWSDNILTLASKLDFQSLIDFCWCAFNNPIVLMDANCKVLAISNQYDENDVDSEWSHLKKCGYSSINAIRYLRGTYTYTSTFYEQGAQYFNFINKELETPCISSSLYNNDMFCGRINILQKDRQLNNGDIQLLDYLVSIITPYISTLALNNDSPPICNIFLSIINNEEIDLKDLQTQLDYIDWKDNDNFRVCILSHNLDKIPKSLISMYCGVIESNLSYSHAFVKNKKIVIIFNERKTPYSNAIEILKNIAIEASMKLSISLPLKDLKNLAIFYNQALYAFNSSQSYNPSSCLINFYDYALDYIIESSFSINILYACHPDVLNLWQIDERSSGNKIDTLYSYLTNERSITNTAQEMYLHRNTLIYRIKKIIDLLEYDINDVYTRDYIILSIKVLKLYQNKYKDKFNLEKTQNSYSVVK